MRIDNSSILAIHPVTNARMGSEAHSWEAKAVRHETPSSGALLRLRESGDLDADNNAQGDELVGAMVKGDRDLRSLASPSDAGIDTHSRLSIKVGDGTWVKVQFESFQRISVTKDGLTTLFAYTSASGSWPESLVRAFNSIGGGLTSSISSEGRLQLTSSLNDPIHIANEPSGEVNPPPGLASALGLPEGLSPDWYSGEDQLRTGHRLAASSVNLLSGALDQQDAGKGGIFSLARDAYAETTRV